MCRVHFADNYSAPWWACRLSVCLSVHDHVSATTRPIFTNFLCMLPTAVARSSSWSDTLRISGFVDDVIFANKLIGCSTSPTGWEWGSHVRSLGLARRNTRCRQRTLGTNFCSHTHTHPLNGLCPGLPEWAGNRKVKPLWILLKQETVSGSGISWAICKSASRKYYMNTGLKQQISKILSTHKLAFTVMIGHWLV